MGVATARGGGSPVLHKASPRKDGETPCGREGQRPLETFHQKMDINHYRTENVVNGFRPTVIFIARIMQMVIQIKNIKTRESGMGAEYRHTGRGNN